MPTASQRSESMCVSEWKCILIILKAGQQTNQIKTKKGIWRDYKKQNRGKKGLGIELLNRPATFFSLSQRFIRIKIVCTLNIFRIRRRKWWWKKAAISLKSGIQSKVMIIVDDAHQFKIVYVSIHVLNTSLWW